LRPPYRPLDADAGLVTGRARQIDLVSYDHAAESVEKSKQHQHFGRALVSYVHAG